jgi:hypothetical protein
MILGSTFYFWIDGTKHNMLSIFSSAFPTVMPICLSPFPFVFAYLKSSDGALKKSTGTTCHLLAIHGRQPKSMFWKGEPRTRSFLNRESIDANASSII